jgi:hypothetical protein
VDLGGGWRVCHWGEAIEPFPLVQPR